MADQVLEIAYEAARAALREQDGTLTSLRNRATALLSAAMVGTSVSAAVGLLRTDVQRGAVFPPWAAWTLLSLVIAIGAAAMIALWPTRRWSFGPDPAKLLANAGGDIDEVRTAVTKALVTGIERNNQAIMLRGTAYRLGAALLLVEMAVLVIALVVGVG
ncbi:hypothetical protein [Haloechinothrix salitolerans]|uniref:Holin-X, holin superfamily III n=1 Tax=Haloechinothrix salitolerans TaxID=926830 RepID=A0ABW2C171_9PSEU